MDNKRMLLVEKGKFVIIRSEIDNELGFSSFDEFYFYCPVSEFNVDLTGKTYIDYEPDRELYIDESDPTISVDDAPVPEYENLINNIELIRSRKEDPYYGKTFEECKMIKLANLYSTVKSFISHQPNGWPRYDDDLKLNIMNASMTAIATGQPKPENCQAVETWIYTVQQAFFGLKAAVTAAEDMATLNAIDVSYNWFEANYGREGTTAADPAVSTDDLFA